MNIYIIPYSPHTRRQCGRNTAYKVPIALQKSSTLALRVEEMSHLTIRLNNGMDRAKDVVKDHVPGR